MSSRLNADGTIEVFTNSIPLFNTGIYQNGKFYCAAKLSVKVDTQKRQYTVTLDGVRGYSYYRWNFMQHITTWLNNSDATPIVERDKRTFSFPAPGKISNGDINDKPYIPENYGYPANVNKLSKTFNYKADGTPEDCYFYLRDYNLSIRNVVNNKQVSADVHTKVNLAKHIPKLVDTRDNLEGYIFTSGKWQRVTPYIYTKEDGWVPADPAIYSGNKFKYTK